MINISRFILVAIIVTCFLIQAQGADKYNDGNRPYEFGFSIDGEQHRHEKKDEKGLIEGEFGFITADGVYHVTVYATDEQGRFKILSMKNIRVKPYPTYTAKQSSTSARQGHSLEQPASLQTSEQPPVITTTIKPISIERPAKSCSHCSIPTTSTLAPIGPILNQNNNSPNQIGQAGGPKFHQGVKPQSAFISQPNNGNNPFLQQEEGIRTPQVNSQNYPGQLPNSLTGQQAPLEQGLVPPQTTQSFPPQYFVPGQNSPTGTNGPQGSYQGPGSGNALQSPGIIAYPQQSQTPSFAAVGPSSVNPGSENGQNLFNANSASQNPGSAQYPEGGLEPVRENVSSGRSPKRLDDQSSFGPRGVQPNSIQRGLPSGQGAAAPPKKPTLISAQMQIVDKNTDIYRRGPGENEGLPDGLSKDDMTRLLYTFNYTVGFHGHFEEGYSNGVKQGYYFITGRNGVRTRVDYVADAKGFHPKISQEVLDVLSDDVPKPETEKDEKYGLKGYEFKWLYYPVEAKGR